MSLLVTNINEIGDKLIQVQDHYTVILDMRLDYQYMLDNPDNPYRNLFVCQKDIVETIKNLSIEKVWRYQRYAAIKSIVHRYFNIPSDQIIWERNSISGWEHWIRWNKITMSGLARHIGKHPLSTITISLERNHFEEDPF